MPQNATFMLSKLYSHFRPEVVIPGFQMYFRFAATSDVPVLQSVLTLSANSRPLSQYDECPVWRFVESD